MWCCCRNHVHGRSAAQNRPKNFSAWPKAITSAVWMAEEMRSTQNRLPLVIDLLSSAGRGSVKTFSRPEVGKFLSGSIVGRWFSAAQTAGEMRSTQNQLPLVVDLLSSAGRGFHWGFYYRPAEDFISALIGWRARVCLFVATKAKISFFFAIKSQNKDVEHR